ncbi:hypothetical protein ScPMuIL_016856 [Solemya velum]
MKCCVNSGNRIRELLLIVISVSFIMVLLQTYLMSPAQNTPRNSRSMNSENEPSLSVPNGTVIKAQSTKGKYETPVLLLKQLYQVRHQLVEDVCSRRPELFMTKKSNYEMKIDLAIEEKHPVGYCAMPKLASTFWGKVLPGRKKLAHINQTDLTQGPHTLKRPFTFMFVRNPYERVLSGYVDKLFVPNTLFWGWTGQYILQKYRANSTELSLRCGHDVTFPEFFHYLVQAEKGQQKSNAHFSPMYRHCGPCRKKYDVIGHFETFTQDTNFILETIMNETGLDLSVNIDKSVTERTRIQDKIRLVYGMKKKILKCMNFQEALERVWKGLQIRGFLGVKVKMPLSLDESENFSADQIVDVILEARKKSTASDRRSNNKDALTEAFRQVPLSTLEMYLNLYGPDFELYGYEKRPEAIFDRTTVEDKTYRYFKLDHETKK